MIKKTLVIGASIHPDRYSYQAVKLLRNYGHEVVALGTQEGKVADVDIQVRPYDVKDIDTITLYLNPMRQKEMEDYILSIEPKRIIFNPGAENSALAIRAHQQGIEVENACTLVMLRTGQY